MILEIREEIKKAVDKAIKDSGFDFKEELMVDRPKIRGMGDLSTPVAMSIAKEVGMDPVIVANKIADKAKDILGRKAERIEVEKPGFINFYLSDNFWIAGLDFILQKKEEECGKTETMKGLKLVIEHTSPNPNKAMHLGHLRNNVLGMALVRLMEVNGVEVVSEAVNNNRGIAIARLVWGYLKFARKDGEEDKTDPDYWREHKDEWQNPDDLGLETDQFVDRLYVKGVADTEVSIEAKEKTRRLVVDWEAGNEAVRELTDYVLNFSYAGQEKTLNRLGNRWDKVWNESDHYKMGKEMVKEGLEKGVFRKLEDGAVLTDLERFGLTDTVIQKADGTALYLTQDIALTKLKKETYKADKYWWVIGSEQSLALKQLFAICEQFNIGTRNDFEHIAYGYMSIKGRGKISSRAGNVVYIDELINLVKERVIILLVKDDMTEIEKRDLAEKVAVGAIKYNILKVGRMRDVAFDVEKSVDLNGDSGVYLQYTYARARSVLVKAESLGIKPKIEGGERPLELEKMVVMVAMVVEAAAREKSPNYLALYLYELAGEFNSYYAARKIVVDDEFGPYRVAVTAVVKNVLGFGMRILGVPVVDKI